MLSSKTKIEAVDDENKALENGLGSLDLFDHAGTRLRNDRKAKSEGKYCTAQPNMYIPFTRSRYSTDTNATNGQISQIVPKEIPPYHHLPRCSVEQRIQSGDRGEISGAKQRPEKSQRRRRAPSKLGSSGNWPRRRCKRRRGPGGRFRLAVLSSELVVQGASPSPADVAVVRGT